MSAIRVTLRNDLYLLVITVLLTITNVGASGMDTHSPHVLHVALKWSHRFQFAGYYAALHKGFYRDAGLNVQLHAYAPGESSVELMLTGQADYAVSDTKALLYRSSGVPLIALAAVFQKSPLILVTKESSGIRALEDLRGKRVMLHGGPLNIELMTMLEAAGLHADEFLLQTSTSDIHALISDQTDAYSAYTTNEPYLLKQLDIPYRVFAPASYNLDFYGDVLITTESRLQNDPDGVHDFLEATLDGWRYAIEHPEEIVDIIIEHYEINGRTREHLLFEAREYVRLILPQLVPLGQMNIERWGRIRDALQAQGRLQEEVDLEPFLYRSVREQAARKTIEHYSSTVIAALIIGFAFAMLIHFLRLRSTARLRTRELQEMIRHAEVEARTDPLTSLPNRRAFLEALARDLARRERNNIPVAVILIDIDHFKAVNDHYGHFAGDTALRTVAAVLSAQVRGGDIAARIGGEEFALACVDADEEEMRHLAERLRIAVATREVHYDDVRFGVTISLGLAFHRPGESLDQLLQRADSALYRAKESGRNKICEAPTATSSSEGLAFKADRRADQ